MKISKNRRGANPQEQVNDADLILALNRLNETRLLKRKSLVAYPKNYRDLDRLAFDAVVDHALGTDEDSFPRMAGQAAKEISPRFFEAAAAAARALIEGKTRKPTKTDAHVIALLQSKLYLEIKQGELPTKKSVRSYAVKVFEKWFSKYGLTPNKNKSELWKDYFTESGLDYLPEGTRGNAQK